MAFFASFICIDNGCLHPILNTKNNFMRTTFLKSMIGIVALAFGYAFSAPAGGDSYEIYLGEKKLVQQFEYDKKPVPILTLTREDAGKPILVTYSHCGTVGRQRAIVVRTGNGVQKKWEYPDVATATHLTGSTRAMKLSVNELVEIKKKNRNDDLELFYYSKELPKGKLLAKVN